MTVETYDDLVSTIADYLDRDDLANRIPTFIQIAETRINRKLRVYWKTKYSYYPVSESNVDIPLPDGFLGVRTLTALTVPPKPLRYLEAEAANTGVLLTSQSGNPSFFTIIANRLRVLPAPQIELDIECVYYFRDTPLGPDNQTNRIITNVPDLILYGSLIEANPFLKDDPRMATWITLFTEGVIDANEEDENFRWGDNVLTMTSEYNSSPSGTRVSTG